MPINPTIKVSVPKQSGKNMSHRNSGTLTCGTLTPILVEEVIPGTRCHLRIPEVVQLPPLVSDTYMNVKLKHEAFFVPIRLLCKSAEDWFADFEHLVGASSDSTNLANYNKANLKPLLPKVTFDSTTNSSKYKAGTLLDYLGFKVDAITGTFGFSPLSAIAYHLIWQEFYRNPRVQLPAFIDDLGNISPGSSSISSQRMSNVRNIYFHEAATIGSVSVADNHVIPYSPNAMTLGDGVNLFSLRQRNFGLDYFTAARPSPQQGSAAAIAFNVDTSTGDGSLTIAQIRAGNSLQMFRERNHYPSPRMVDQVKARYNVDLSDGVAQRPICIGSASYDIVTRGVDQTAAGSASADNPFNTVGSQYGRAFGVASDTPLIDYFEAKEPGFIIVLQSLVPDVTYSTGVSAYLRRYTEPGSIVEMATPLLQNIGDEPIYCPALGADPAIDTNVVFAYQDRYGSFCFHPNEVHGLLRDGQSLDTFVLQRSFAPLAGAFTYGSGFLEIPKTYLDGVFAVSSAVSGFSAWYDAKLDWRISHPLADFSVPSLQDPAYEHGDFVTLYRNGQIF